MTLATMYGLVSQRLNEGFGAGGPTFYPTVEIVAALNEADRLFCLLTLALEKTTPWTVPANTTFFHMLQTFPDWIVPLMLTTAAGAKVRPADLSELAALDSQWTAVPGAPRRYAALGADLVAVYPQPVAPTVLTLTYVRCPVAMAADTDVPETPAEYHPAYVGYAIYRLRQVEGGAEFAKALPFLDDFLSAASQYAGYVRRRNAGQSYDRTPFELAAFDRSALMSKGKS